VPCLCLSCKGAVPSGRPDESGHDSAPGSACSRGRAVAGTQVASRRKAHHGSSRTVFHEGSGQARGTLTHRRKVGTRGRPVLFQPREPPSAARRPEGQPASFARRLPPPGEAMPAGALPGGACEVGGDDVGGVPAQAAAGPVILHRWPGDPRGTPLPARPETGPGVKTGRAAVMKACRSVCGVTILVIPARRAVLPTMRPAPCRSSGRPSAARNSGPSVREPA
jgi:hypothetical protein